MKTVYIPRGGTVAYENLTTEYLVVDGYLKVACDLKAKTISGSGFIEAGQVSADDIRMDDLESAGVVCRRLIAKRVETSELFASESAAVSCLLSADLGGCSWASATSTRCGLMRWSASNRRNGVCSGSCWRPACVPGGCGLPPPPRAWLTRISSRPRRKVIPSSIWMRRRSIGLRPDRSEQRAGSGCFLSCHYIEEGYENVTQITGKEYAEAGRASGPGLILHLG